MGERLSADALADPDFRGLPRQRQLELLIQATPGLDDPDFKGLPRDRQLALVHEAQPHASDDDIDDVVSRVSPTLGANAAAGYARGAGGTMDMLTNLVRPAGAALATGVLKAAGAVGAAPEMPAGELYDAIHHDPAMKLPGRERLERAEARGGTGSADRAVQFLPELFGAGPGMVAATEAGGPILGLAGYGAAQAATPEATAEEVAKAGFESGLAGLVFKGTETLPAPVRVPLVGGANYALTGDPVSSVGFGLLSGMDGGPRAAKLERRAAAEEVNRMAREGFEASDEAMQIPVPPEPAEPAQPPPTPEGVSSEPPPEMPDWLPEQMKAKGSKYEPGENYVGMHRYSTMELEKVPPPRAKLRREGEANDILAKAFRQPIREGRARLMGHNLERSVLGFYVPKDAALKDGTPLPSRLLNVLRRGDSQVGGHEMLHFLVDHVPAFRRIFERPPEEIAKMAPAERSRFEQVQRELSGVSYDKDNLEEGLAELMRHWLSDEKVLTEPRTSMLKEASLPARAPAALEEFKAAIETLPKKQRRAMYDAQKALHSYFEQGPVANAKSKVGPEPRAAGRLLETKGSVTREHLFDALQGFRSAEHELFGRDLPGGAWQLSHNLAGSPWVARGMIEKGVPSWVVVNERPGIRFTGESLESILGAKGVGGSKQMLDDSLAYFDARQARELFDQKREKLFDDQHIVATINLYDTAERRAAFERLKKFQSKAVDFAVKGGLLSRENVKRWRRLEYASSFAREMGGAGGAGGDGGSMGIGSSTGIHRLGGKSSRNLRDPLERIMGSPARLVQLTLENRVRQHVASYANARGGGLLLAPMSVKDAGVIAYSQAARERLLGMAKDAEGIRPGALEDMIHEFPDLLDMMTGGTDTGGRNVMKVFVDGKPRYFEVFDPQLLRALGSLRKTQIESTLLSFMDGLRRFSQKTVTANPVFALRQLPRDWVMAQILSRTGFHPLSRATAGIRALASKNDTYWDYFANGGGGATVRDNAEFLGRKARAFAKGKGLDPSKLLVTPKDVVHFLESIGDHAELINRLGEFELSQKQGRGLAESAFRGREIGNDYAQRGSSKTMQVMSRTMRFFSAMMASADRLYRATFREPDYRASTGGALALVMLGSAALFMENRENDEYNALPDWQKRAYWHWFTPLGHVMSPKAWEAGTLGTVAELIMGAGLGDEQWGDSFQKMGYAIRDNFGLSFPPGLDVLYEQVWSGKNAFTGTPIEPEYAKEHREPSDVALARTPATLRAFGELERGSPVQLSPARLDAMLRTTFGPWATYGMQLSDWMFFDKERQALYLDELPGIGSFYQRDGKYSRYEEEFYDAKSAIDKLQGSYAYDQATGREPREYSPAEERDRMLYGYFDQASRNLSGINHLIEQIRRDPTLSSVERRDRTDELRKQQVQVMKTQVELRRRMQRGQQ